MNDNENKHKNNIVENKRDENENENDCDYRKVRKSDIIIPSWIPREPKMITDADHDLGDSIKETGMLNPLTVRETEDGKLELNAGSRRLGATDKDTVWVNVRRDKSIYNAMIVCATENYHRKDINEVDRDDFFYRLYDEGIKEGKIKNMRDMAKDTSMREDTLRRYINAGKERAKNKNNDIISKASTSSLNTTKKLKSVPKIRDRLLEMEQKKIILKNNVCEITKKIEMCIDKGVPERVISKMIDMSTTIFDGEEIGGKDIKVKENKESDNGRNANFVSNSDGGSKGDGNNDEDCKNGTKVIAFNVNEFDDLSNIMAISQPDVQEYIISEKIDWKKDALDLNKFETKEQRRQILVEKTKIENWKKKSQEIYDREWANNYDIRIKQAEEIKNNGETSLKTNFDIEHQQRLNLAKNANDRHDEEVFRRYRSLSDHLNRVILHYHPTNMKTDKGKDVVKGIVRNMYEYLRLLMIEIGEIKTADKSENSSFGSHVVDVEAKAEDV